jgi:putative PIN family toxin of toxin-antitoxin system
MSIVRVVLDTNVLVAASRSRDGASFAVMQALRAGRFTALASVPLVLEYEAVLKRETHVAAGKAGALGVDAMLDAMLLRVQPVHIHYLWRPQLRDPADEMVLETALNGRADALVTFNLADFAAASNFALPVITPVALLRRLNEE